MSKEEKWNNEELAICGFISGAALGLLIGVALFCIFTLGTGEQQLKGLELYANEECLEWATEYVPVLDKRLADGENCTAEELECLNEGGMMTCHCYKPIAK